MQTLRNAKLIARFVLVWFAFSIGVAVASPVVKPQGMLLVCSVSGTIKVIAAGDGGQTQSSNHTLDCPLCASTSAPPPLEMVAFEPTAPAAFAQPVSGAASAFSLSAAPAPARGPPAQS